MSDSISPAQAVAEIALLAPRLDAATAALMPLLDACRYVDWWWTGSNCRFVPPEDRGPTGDSYGPGSRLDREMKIVLASTPIEYVEAWGWEVIAGDARRAYLTNRRHEHPSVTALPWGIGYVSDGCGCGRVAAGGRHELWLRDGAESGRRLLIAPGTPLADYFSRLGQGDAPEHPAIEEVFGSRPQS